MAESNKKSKPVSDAQRRKDELIAELARARVGISLHGGQVAYQADIGRRARATLTSSFRHHLGVWLAGALVAGGAASLLPMRERKVYVNPLSKDGKGKLSKSGPPRGGFLISLLKALTPIIKPLLTAFITKKLANLVEGAEGAQKAAERTADKADEATAQAQNATAEAAAAA